MPIYEYRCNDCGHEFETIQKISESPLQTCPSCSEDALIKKISAAGFRLAGSGWYETDFKSGNKRN
ncbi:MAG: zinc ribbon domain-containing protein, partial [Pseudomonadales bacterium]